MYWRKGAKIKIKLKIGKPVVATVKSEMVKSKGDDTFQLIEFKNGVTG